MKGHGSPHPFIQQSSPKSPPPRLRPLPGYRKVGSKEDAAAVAAAPMTIPNDLFAAFDGRRVGGGDDASPSGGADAAPERRLGESERACRRRLAASIGAAPTHAPAGFMLELTAFVETQLQLLEKQHPAARLADAERGPTAEEQQLRLHGRATMSAAERQRRQRLDVFIAAQRMFAECFPSYKLFLDAVTDEHLSYHAFVDAELTRHKEVLLGMRAATEQRRAAAAADVAAAEARTAEKDAALRAETARVEKLRMQLLEATRSRHQESDAKRRIQTLENELRELQEKYDKTKDQLDDAVRLNEQLFLGTFSDALDHTNQQLAELRNQSARKDELLMEAHDEVASLTRDLKAVAKWWNDRSERTLEHTDLRLGAPALRALFPDEARKTLPRTY